MPRACPARFYLHTMAEKIDYQILADQHQALVLAGKHDEAAKFHAENIATYNGEKPRRAKAEPKPETSPAAES